MTKERVITDSDRLNWFVKNKTSIMFDQEAKKWTICWGSLVGRDTFDSFREAIDVKMERDIASGLWTIV